MAIYYRGSKVTPTGFSRMDGNDEYVEIRFARNGKAHWVLGSLLKPRPLMHQEHAVIPEEEE